MSLALLICSSLPALCQNDDLAVGKLLVASRDLGDPNFAKTVILLVHYDEDQGAVGLIINKRTDVPLSRAFHDMKEAAGRNDPIYIGGPVELNSVMALLKSAKKPEGADRVFGDIYLITNKDVLTRTLGSRVEASAFHAYIGYAGWQSGQLEHELELGAWHIMHPESAMIFHADPDGLWERLISRTETNIARLFTYTPPLPSLARR